MNINNTYTLDKFMIAINSSKCLHFQKHSFASFCSFLLKKSLNSISYSIQLMQIRNILADTLNFKFFFLLLLTYTNPILFLLQQIIVTTHGRHLGTLQATMKNRVMIKLKVRVSLSDFLYFGLLCKLTSIILQ